MGSDDGGSATFRQMCGDSFTTLADLYTTVGDSRVPCGTGSK